MRIIQATRDKPFHAIVPAIVLFFLQPTIQSLSTPLAYEVWFKTLADRPLNGALYIAVSALFGALISLYFYAKSKCMDCKKSDVNVGFSGTILGFALGICPACFSLIGVLLPLGGSIFLTTYAPAFTALSISIILFSIYRLGGFKKK